MNYGSGSVQMHPQVPQNPFYNFYEPANVPTGIGHTANEITSADSHRVGKKIIDDAFAHAAAFATHQWIHIELPSPGPIPPAYPADIDPLAGLSPGNAAAIGRKYFHDTVSSIKNFVMPPSDPTQVAEPLEFNRDEGLSARNTGIVGRRVVEDILSCIIESSMNTVALIYSVGRTVINVVRKIFGMPILEEPTKRANPADAANDLNELDALDDIDEEPEVDVDAEEAAGDADPEILMADVDLDPVDDVEDGDDLVEDGLDPVPLPGDAAHDDLFIPAPPGGDPAGFGAPAAAALVNPVHNLAGGGMGIAAGAPHGHPRRVHAPAHRPAARPPQPVAPPPPRIEDTDPFYTQIPLLTPNLANDLTFLLTALNGTAGSIAMNAVGLRAKGANVDVVHPFRFLAHVMTNQDLRNKFKSLRERPDMFGAQFVSEFDAKFSSYQDRGQLIPYHKGFAHAMRVNPKTVETLCNEKKWKLLILLLHETASGAKAPFVPKVPVVKPTPLPARTSHQLRATASRAPAPDPTFTAQQPFQLPIHDLTGSPGSFLLPGNTFVNPTGEPLPAFEFADASHLGEHDDLVDGDLALDDVHGDGMHTPLDLDEDRNEDGEEIHLNHQVAGDHLRTDPEVQEDDDFDDLAALTAAKPLTPEQQATAARIFEQVATSDPITLGVSIRNIKNDWRQLHDTHPAMLLKEVFGNDAILQNLRTIHRDFTKRDLFINDLSDACAKGETKNSDTALEKTQEALTELGITRQINNPIPWKDLLKDLITLKCTIIASEALTAIQTQTIDEVLTSIATTNEFMLLGQLISLRKKWSSLEQACPLQTLRYLFTQKKDLVSQIISQSFKKGPFLTDVATTLKNSCKMRDISLHTSDFASEFGVSVDLLNHKEWSTVLNEMIASHIPQDLQRAASTSSLPRKPLTLPLPPPAKLDPQKETEPTSQRPATLTPAPVVVTPVPKALATSDPLSPVQKGTIDEIFSSIATKNELWLLGNLVPLERKWASLEQACPLQILRYVFTDKKDLFHQINDKAVRRGPFLLDLAKTLKNCGKDRDLSSFADAFASEFDVPADMVIKKDWSSMIDTIKRKQIDETERSSRTSSGSGGSTVSSSSVFQNVGAKFKGFGGIFGGKK